MSQTFPRLLIPSIGRTPAPFRSAAGVALALSLSMLLGACASDMTPRTTGERLADRGDAIGSYGASWSEGEENVRRGEKAMERSSRSLAEAERDLERANSDLAKAQQQINDAAAARATALKRIEDGRVQMTRAEADYAATKAGPSAVGPEG